VRYNLSAHVVNVLFIAIVFVAPIGYCLSNPSIPIEVGTGVIMLSFFLGAIAITDWYGPRFSNSLQGILLFIAFGGMAALVIATVASWKSGVAFIDVALFKTYDGWDGSRRLLRMYAVSIGALFLGIVSLPRLLLLRIVASEALSAR
jgi:hypothetical protein